MPANGRITPSAMPVIKTPPHVMIPADDALAWALFQNGKIVDAAQAMDRALSQNSPEPVFHDHAARIFKAAGREDEAAAHRLKARDNYW